tara:strand:- start:1696 stop:1962 length:267 start_codon:yes stop_codon:yes gene_type:complete
MGIKEIETGITEADQYILLEPRERFDSCAVGVVEGYGQSPRVCYSYTKVIEVLLEDGGSLEDVQDHFTYNILGSYAGENTPCFLFQGA